MFNRMLRFIIRLLFIPIKLPFEILFSRKYHEKVVYFTLSKIPLDLRSGSTSPMQEDIRLPDEAIVATGGGIYGVRGRWIIDLHGGGGGVHEQQDLYTLAVGAGGGALNLGFLLKNGPRLRIYPFAGFGGGGSGASVQKHEGEQMLNVGSGGPLYYSGLATEFKLSWGFGILFGLRLGMQSGLGSSYRAPFMTAYIGLGWFGLPRRSTRSKAINEEKSDTTRADTGTRKAPEDEKLRVAALN